MPRISDQLVEFLAKEGYHVVEMHVFDDPTGVPVQEWTLRVEYSDANAQGGA